MKGAKEYYDQLLSGMVKPPPAVAAAMQTIGRMGITDTSDPYVWIPARRLYDDYLLRLPVATVATPREFGLALRLCFPAAERVCRRLSSTGQSVAGWAGITWAKMVERAVDREDSNKRRKNSVKKTGEVSDL